MTQASDILILGHRGFIGSRLLEQFKKSRPGAIVRGFSGRDLDLTSHSQTMGLIPYLKLSSVVVICSGIKGAVDNSPSAFRANIEMAINLLALFKKQRVRKVVYFSSASVYGEDRHLIGITEQTPVNPISYYGISKYSSERLFQRAFSGEEQPELLLLRPSIVYGPGNHNEGYRPSGFARAALAGGSIWIWGDGLEKRDFIYIDDLVGLVDRLIDHPFQGVLNIASGEPQSYRMLAECTVALLDRPVTLRHRPRTGVRVDQTFSVEMLQKIIPDYRMTIPKEGIRRTVEYVKQHG
ncbi:MAG: NAD(P)-dependent oxidoreductase [Candidatus Sedimenticola sp. (ex Thyasira tokunagai)]